jgi:flavin reductase (DIM6/NTAB) family NADH-FMN oxidoreductase RutF
MALKSFNPRDLSFNPFEKIDSGCLITPGTPDDFNTMTASWGFMGIMWTKNVIATVIRPNRYTFDFIKKHDLFTVSFLECEDSKKILAYCGSHSGRDVDKMKETGLVAVEVDGAVTFEQASMVFVCKKIYTGDMDINNLDMNYMKFVGTEPMHTAFIGEVIGCYLAD